MGKMDGVLELTCRVIGSPKPDIKWFKDNKEIKSSSTTKISQDGNTCFLKTSRCTKADFGTYKCQATNVVGSVDCQANVEEYVSEKRKPEFEEVIKSTSIKLNDILELKCKVTGDPKPSIKWFKDGREIKQASNTRITQEGQECVLKTSKFTKSEIGTYKCVATNSVGTAQCEANVDEIVPDKKKPVFEEVIKSTDVKINDGFELRCKVTGVPNPTIKWFKDGKEIRSTSNTKTIQEGMVCILKTSKFTKADIGTYKCVATNEVGTAECEANVTEDTKKPEFQEVLKPVVVTISGALELRCVVVGEPKPIIKWFKNGMEIRSSSATRMIQEGTMYILKTSKVSKTDIGLYKCVASNSAGTAQCEAEVTLEGEEPKDQKK